MSFSLPESSPSEKPEAPRKSSNRGFTLGPENTVKVPKRIIVCCDGTWQDGITCKGPLQYTNILKIARAIDSEDLRSKTPIPQVVFYQAGVGTDSLFFMDCLDGAVGTSLRDKVEEAYAFIASNYQPWDEIFLFGFSRGAYTARTVASFIGEIGVLNNKDMSQFAKIFDAYQEKAHIDDEQRIAELEEFLAPYTNSQSLGHRRADADGDKFTIKYDWETKVNVAIADPPSRFLGVFDTVGAMGLPRELRISRKTNSLFGFPNKQLGEHIQYGYQALAIHEIRKDFTAAKFEQTKKGRAKGQILKQVWFSGSHSDIGGGYKAHDLSDLTLMWMASHFEPFLSLDLDYLLNHLPQPVDSWGKQPPHNPRTGIFTLAYCSPREFPSLYSDKWPSHEYIHPSVLHQPEEHLPHEIRKLIKHDPDIVCELEPLEKQAKEFWHKHAKQNKAMADAEDAYGTMLFGLRPLIQVILQFFVRIAHWLSKL